jgi:hypothetical protein
MTDGNMGKSNVINQPRSNNMQAQEKFLRFEGTTKEALEFVLDLRDLGNDAPNVLYDLMVSIENQLQREGVLDENFNVIDNEFNGITDEGEEE